MLRTLYLILTCMIFLPATNAVMAEEISDTNTTRILVWGDSLSAAYGIPVQQGWVSLLQNKLGDSYHVINGSISGETTAGGLTRLPEALKQHQPHYLLLELGANDGLRGIALSIMQANLEQMIKLAQAADIQVVLIGVLLPPNFGPAFTDKFTAVYHKLAQQYELPLIPRLLADVAENWDLMQADGLHPTAAAQEKVLNNVWPSLEPLLMPNPTEMAPATKK